MIESPVSRKRFFNNPRFWIEDFVSLCMNVYENISSIPRIGSLLLLFLIISIFQVVTYKAPTKHSLYPAYHTTNFEPAPPLNNYIGLVGSYDKLYTIRADGTGLTEIMGVAPLRLIDAQWSPDGRSILFLAVDSYYNTPGSLYVMPSSGGGRHLIAEEVAWDFQWMADSRHILFRARDKNSDTYTSNLYRYSLDDNTTTKIADHIEAFSLSTDEQHLTMTQKEPNRYQDTDLITANIDGSQPNLLTPDVKQYHVIGWFSTTDEFLYLESASRDGYYNYLYLTDREGSVSSQITSNRINVGVALSPDERHVAYVEVENREQLVIAPSNAITSSIPLTTTTIDIANHKIYDIHQILWSSNGKGIALMGYRPLQNPSDSMEGQIHLVWFADPKVAKYAIPTSARHGIWLPDRPTIIYETEAPMYSRVELYDLATDSFIDLGVSGNFDWRFVTTVQEYGGSK
jgi:hypothetical protein